MESTLPYKNIEQLIIQKIKSMNCDITDCMLSESRQAILKKQFKQLFPDTKQHALHRKDRLALLKCQKL